MTGEYAPGRLGGGGPVAVIDIGSNSVRLVVYERLARSTTPFFNEKVLAGLGRGVADDGRLSDESVASAMSAITRFRTICDLSGVVKLHALATAAVRDAENGETFIARVEEVLRQPVAVLSGREEAMHAAYGVISGIWHPDGIAGDMGGGSLEIIDLRGTGIGSGRTMPLGALHLQRLSGDSPRKAEKFVNKVLDEATMLDVGRDRAFYAVGGTWRSIARLHMHQTDYPLHVMHQYTIDAETAFGLCESLIRDDPDSIPMVDTISKQRRGLLPYGALVLRGILQRMQAREVVISALGVREGLLYEALGRQELQRDPLISACEELAFLRSRSPRHAHELGQWTDQLVSVLGIDESADERRLRIGACLLADIGWRAHPDNIGEQAFSVIANAAFVGVDHPGRTYLALAVLYRHVGVLDDAQAPAAKALVSERAHHRACVTGLALRVGYLLSAAMPGIVLKSRFELEDGVLKLLLPSDLEGLDGERLRKRLHQLARLLGYTSEIVIVEA